MQRATPAQVVEALRSVQSEANATVVVDGEKKAVGFKGVAYSGGSVRRWFGSGAIDLAGMELPPAEVPILLNHDPDKIVGRAKVTCDGRSIMVDEGTFTAATQYGREVAALMAEGHPWQFSIGADGDYVQADRKKPVQLNGRRMELDSYLTKTRLLEVSFCPAGADPKAIAAKLSARYSPDGATSMPNDDQTDALATANAKIAELERANAQLKAENEAAAKLAKEEADKARKARIDALFDGVELADDEREAYMGMTAAQFAAVEKREQTLRKQSDPALFSRQAKGGRNPDKGTESLAAVKPVGGLPADEERAKLHVAALNYMAENKGVDYLAAVAAVEEQQGA